MRVPLAAALVVAVGCATGPTTVLVTIAAAPSVTISSLTAEVTAGAQPAKMFSAAVNRSLPATLLIVAPDASMDLTVTLTADSPEGMLASSGRVRTIPHQQTPLLLVLGAFVLDGGLDSAVDGSFIDQAPAIDLQPTTPDLGRVNLVPNPGFEVDVSGWGTGYGSATRVADPHSGSWSARLCVAQIPAPYYTLNSDALPGPTVPNATYTAGAWVKLLDPTRNGAFLNIRQHVAGVSTQMFMTAQSVTGWQYLTTSLVTSPQTNVDGGAKDYLDIYIGLTPPASPSTSDCVEIDDATLFGP